MGDLQRKKKSRPHVLTKLHLQSPSKPTLFVCVQNFTSCLVLETARSVVFTAQRGQYSYAATHASSIKGTLAVMTGWMNETNNALHNFSCVSVRIFSRVTSDTRVILLHVSENLFTCHSFAITGIGSNQSEVVTYSLIKNINNKIPN